MTNPPSIPDALLRRGLPAAISIVERIRREVIALARHATKRSPEALISAARKVVAAHEPLMARTMRDSLILAWLTAARKQAGELPPLTGELTTSVIPPNQPPPFLPPTAKGRERDPAPVVRFPQIDAAAADLQRRGFFDRAAFEQLDQDARRTAFTVARVQSLDAMRRIRDAIHDDVTQGGTLAQFQQRIAADVAGALSPSQTEAIYRTHVAQAMATGQRAVLDHPLVGDEFPYVLFTATHDSRTRPDHIALERWGQNGTAVYRRDDPIWDVLWPPMGWNCRCHCIVLNLEDAAAHGSREAAKWLKSGVPPTSPIYARTPYPVKLPKNWPTHERVASIL